MDQSISHILCRLYQSKRLGNLYIIRPPLYSGPEEESLSDGQQSGKDYLRTWYKDLLADFLSLEKKIPHREACERLELGFSDFYLIDKEEEDREYKVSSQPVLDFIKAQSYPPLESSYKVIVVDHADKLSKQVANKWLKTLEEPMENIVTFLIAHGQTPLLQTIESRAITLRLTTREYTREEKHEHNHFQEYADLGDFLTKRLQSPLWQEQLTQGQQESLKEFVSTGAPHIFLDAIKGNKPFQERLLVELFNFVEMRCTSPRLLDAWLNEYKWFSKARVYNNVLQERWVGLLQMANII